jgi:NitT/TauT family transport system ATP-binding protein
VVVLSKGKVLAEVEVPLARPRVWDKMVADDQFKDLSNQVLALVRSA